MSTPVSPSTCRRLFVTILKLILLLLPLVAVPALDAAQRAESALTFLAIQAPLAPAGSSVVPAPRAPPTPPITRAAINSDPIIPITSVPVRVPQIAVRQIADRQITEEPPEARTLEARCAAMVASAPVAPPPGWTVTCDRWKRNVAGETDPSSSTITVHVADDDDDDWLRRVLTHELGHAHDFSMLTWSDRDRWQRARGFSAQWFTTCACSDSGYGGGDFAESFMYTFLPAGRPSFASRLAPPPTLAQQELLRSMVG